MRLLSLLSSLGVGSALAMNVIIGNVRPLVWERLDPIVSPGAISQHAHVVFGASNFHQEYTYNNSRASTCTTATLRIDKSNYWTPALYYYDPKAKTFTAIPVTANFYYLSGNGHTRTMPAGLQMLAGTPMRRTYNPANTWEHAISYLCQDFSGANHTGDPDWLERPDFFPHQCPNGLRAQVYFPSCWDGKRLSSPDYSHVAYPTTTYNMGPCPASHPVAIQALFIEFEYSVQNFPYNGKDQITWVLANGDVTGLGLHADFTSGWPDYKGSPIDNAVKGCNNDAQPGLEGCKYLAPFVDQDSANSCVPAYPVVSENYGVEGPIKKLPGCNPLWIGTGPKPTCDPAPATPGFQPAASKLEPGWKTVGCVAEGITGRLLDGASVDWANMTGGICTKYCASKGYSLAGTEYYTQCYCGNTFAAGGTGAKVKSSNCHDVCRGRATEVCGGNNFLTLYKKT